MKNVLLIWAMIAAFTAVGQTETPSAAQTDSIPTIGVDEPVFPGGNKAMSQFLNKHLVYPQKALENGIQGKVYLEFKVDADGALSDIRVIRGIANCPECDQEAIRLFQLMPKWIPAKRGGKNIETVIHAPLTFWLY